MNGMVRGEQIPSSEFGGIHNVGALFERPVL